MAHSTSAAFSAFNITNAAYKHVNGHPIPVSILVPKDLVPGSCSVLVRFHGGGLVGGARLFEEWFPKWILEFASSRNTIVVTPDYRLMPEASGKDVLEDLADFWTWLQSNLASQLPAGITPNFDSTLVTGESAGGYLAFQSAFSNPKGINIAAVIAQYPMLDISSPHFTVQPVKPIFNLPNFPPEILQGHVDTLQGGEVATERPPQTTLPLFVSMIQQGRYVEFLGQGSELFPMLRLEGVSKLPPAWILHGRNDSVVPTEGSRVFVNKAKRIIPSWDVRTSYEEGEHGFDQEASLDTGYVREGVEWMGQYWPRP